ncbi:MAG: serine O-acetyltransferase [Solirubrobacterales bacterium]
MSLVRRVLALPALLAFALTNRKELILADVRRWAEVERWTYRMPGTLLDLIVKRTEFRTLMYHRLRNGNAAGRIIGRLAFVLLPQRVALYLASPEIGPGLYIQHGFATGVDAEYIGANVWINQQVTIGHGVGKDGVARVPRIEDGATIYAGAKVLGNVRVGRNAVVGANAVVLKDVPDNALAVGVPARIIERPPQ